MGFHETSPSGAVELVQRPSPCPRVCLERDVACMAVDKTAGVDQWSCFTLQGHPLASTCAGRDLDKVLDAAAIMRVGVGNSAVVHAVAPGWAES